MSDPLNPTSAEALRPWYRQPWLWFLLSVPIASVILSSIMVTVAVRGKDAMVSDNYYKDGMAINQTIEQDQVADRLNLRPELSIEANGSVLLAFDTPLNPPEPWLTLKVIHPTIGDRDVEIRLLPTESGFSGDLPSALQGRWILDLYSHDKTWRIREQIDLPLSRQLLNQDG